MSTTLDQNLALGSGLPPLPPWGAGRTELKVIYLTALCGHWALGREEKQKVEEARGASGQTPHTLPSDSSPYSIFPRPKNSLVEDTFNSIFLF